MEKGSLPSAGFYDFLGWVETNKKRVAIGAGVAIFLAVVMGLFVWRSSEREVEAEEALSAVHVPFAPAEAPVAGTAESYAKVAEEFSKTKAAAKALLRAGTVYFDQGNYAKAQEYFDRLLRNHGDTMWVPQAVFGIAASLDAQNKTTEAITRYNDFIRNYSGDPASDQARFNLVRLYDQTKQPMLAFDLLKKMTDTQAGVGPGTQEANQKLGELLTKYPSLMQSMMPSNPVVTPNIVLPQTSFAPPTNVLNLTNMIRRTNTVVVPTGGPPRILLSPGPTNVGK